MDERLCRVLILDIDPETLIRLQHALEQAEIDTAITWDEIEACQLVATKPFDLVVIGDHPPELNAAAILDDLSFRGSCPPILILRPTICEKDAEHFRRLGAVGVAPKRDTLAVLNKITKTLALMRFKSAQAGIVKARSSQVAS